MAAAQPATAAQSTAFELMGGGEEDTVISYPPPPEGVITPEMRQQWETDGYVVVRGWLPPAEVERLSQMADEVEALPQGPFHTYEKLEENFADFHPGMSMFLRHGTLPSVVHALVGEPVALYKEKVNFKRAGGGGGYAPHQDQYTNFKPDAKPYSFLTQVCMIAVDDCSVNNGCAMLGPECWKRKEGILPAGAEMGPYVPCELKKGDMLVYDNYMPHWSTPNTSGKDRRALFAIYNARSLGDYHDIYYKREAANRRRAGSQPIGGKANQFFTGAPVAGPGAVAAPADAAAGGSGGDSATLAQKEAVLAEIVALYNDKSQYGIISQLKHGCQAAQQALDAGADNETVVAALLHDIGWKLAKTAPFRPEQSAAQVPDQSMAQELGILSFCGIGGDADEERRRAQHDVIGATYLRMRGFSEKVAHLVEGHVLAKRYLTFKEEGYYDLLSPGSKRTLEFQGGPMTAEEAALFEQGPHCELCKQMRRWDEGAKKPEWEVAPFHEHVERVLAAITEPPCDASKAAELAKRTSFVREGNRIAGIRSSRL